jgi:hypothetical protein
VRRADRRSPGIRFESRPPPLPDPLPRMDVTALVGFAASGPLHVPVAIDGARQFANVFGDDVALGWDNDAGQTVRGNLGPAVRAFFRNGGRRCWVVRVAGAARANHFAIPALARWCDSALVPAFATARSEGSWADELAASASLAAQPIAIGSLELGAAGRPLSARLVAPDQVAVGDTLRIALGGPAAAVVVAAIAAVDASVARFGGGPPLWLTDAAPALPDPSALAIAWFPGSPEDGDGEPMAQPLVPAGRPVCDGDALVVPVISPGAGSPHAGALAPGRVVRLRWAGEELWLGVVDVVAAAAGSPPGAVVELRGGWSRRLPGPPPGPAVLDGSALVAERLRLSLWVQRGTERPTRLDDLGLAPGHSSYLGALPTDRALFAADPWSAPVDGDGGDAGVRALAEQLQRFVGDAADPREYYAALWQSVAAPRFPLAIAARADAFVPIAMPAVPGAYLGAQVPAGVAAARDGLAASGAAMFLDPDLADQPVDSLLAQADFVRWQSSAPRPLTGIHALIGVDEVTLIAVPDATQRGWSSASAAPTPVLAPPVLAAARADGDTWQLAWTSATVGAAIDDGTRYAVEADSAADFTHPQGVWTGSATAVRLVDPRPGQPPGSRWFRVRAVQGATAGPWSNALALSFPPPQFQACPAGVQLAPPALAALPPDPRGSIELAWTDVPGAERFTVEEIAGGDAAATVIYQGRDHDLTVRGRTPGAYAYRVRAEQGATVGAWSDPAVQVVPPPRRNAIVRPASFQPDAVLRPVHRAVLRLAAARGDLLAVLALPAHFRGQDATAHVAWLRGPAGEEATWSYAALYHPWLVGDDDPGVGPIPTLPPDGAVCGLIAQRASTRGAWVAPANQPLRGVVELIPALSRDDAERFADAQVNLLRDEPRGILAQSADTLARDADLTAIHVRRLLVLLRRIALRVGPGYVFEPNGAVFQRLVQRGFEAALDDLFARGAFAGAERAGAYQLAVDANPNVADQGRFVVEIKVAPSRPLSFLTVRLVQSGDLGVVTEAR